MSINGIELALYKIQNSPDYLDKFLSSPEIILDECTISDTEFSEIKNWEVKNLASRGVSQMLIMIAWQAVHGFENTPDYIGKMNA